MGLIYHIAYRADWEAARAGGQYTMSSRGLTLAEQGFIHASTAAQVAGTANRFYAGEQDLILLEIDEGRLRPELRYEAPPGGTELFPHIYGPLNLDAVSDTRPLQPGADGRFSDDWCG